MRAVQVAINSLLQAGTILQYSLVLDGHRLLKACIFSYLIYAGPALIILTVRRKSLSVCEEIYVKWGWVFMIAFGIPLILPSIPPLIPPEVLRV
jgi:hypothetical protein